MMSSKTCRTCVLPETSLFPLDASGNCKLCNSPSLLKHIVKKPDPDELERLIELIKRNGKTRDFDCIVGWSGGRDSTFMLHELVRKYHLRCAAVFGRTPFTRLKLPITFMQLPTN